MIAVGTLSVSARATKTTPPRAPPTCGMRSVSIAHTAASGASGTPRTSPTASTNSPIITATVNEPPT